MLQIKFLDTLMMLQIIFLDTFIMLHIRFLEIFSMLQVACTLYPLQQIRQAEDEEISLDTFTTFKSTYTKFKLNEPWDEYTADGRLYF